MYIDAGLLRAMLTISIFIVAAWPCVESSPTSTTWPPRPGRRSSTFSSKASSGNIFVQMLSISSPAILFLPVIYISCQTLALSAVFRPFLKFIFVKFIYVPSYPSSIGRAVCHYFLKEPEVALPCSCLRSICSWFYIKGRICFSRVAYCPFLYPFYSSLEYRGYDSAGIGIDGSASNASIHVRF